MANLAVPKTSHQMKALVKQQQRIRGQYPIDQEGDRRLISTVYVPYEKLTAYEQENYVAWREESLDDVCFTHDRYLNVYHEDDVVQITEETKEVYRASWNNFFCPARAHARARARAHHVARPRASVLRRCRPADWFPMATMPMSMPSAS